MDSITHFERSITLNRTSPPRMCYPAIYPVSFFFVWKIQRAAPAKPGSGISGSTAAAQHPATAAPALSTAVNSAPAPSTAVHSSLDTASLTAINNMFTSNLTAMVPVIEGVMPRVTRHIDEKMATLEESLFKRLRDEIHEHFSDGQRSPTASPMWTR